MVLVLNELEFKSLERILNDFEDVLDSSPRLDDDMKEMGYNDIDIIRKVIWGATSD